MSSPHVDPPRPWKGKAREQPPMILHSRQEGPGGEAGIVLSLDMLETSAYEAVYTLPLTVGNNQNLSVQVDTGSSDLWFASTSCPSLACKQTGGRLYNPAHSTPTNVPFEINYVQGAVYGSIVWDSVQIGGYSIDNQAFAAASTVDSEPLSWDFNGVLGLALSANSVITQRVPAQFSNAPDGAILPSNLFSITPVSSAPSYRFLSLTLERPGSDAVPSRLGIGRHPQVIADPGKVQYAPVVTTSGSMTFWQAGLTDISVYVDGLRKSVDLSHAGAPSPTGAPTAVVDSGMPVILASLDIANGIYGALGIGPAGDGQYYVPCKTPLNMTVTLDNRTAIALHPLDLTTPNSDSSCLGLIQSFPPTADVARIADVILGVPFMRSAYTVMAYDPPASNGSFPDAASASSTQASLNVLNPRLGLLGLTDPAVALDEFHTVRVLNQPLPSAHGAQVGAGGSGAAGKRAGGGSEKKLSVGVEVLIGLVGFFALCVGLFGARWFVQRRRMRRERARAEVGAEGEVEGKEGYMMQDVAYRLARRSSYGSRYGPSEETIRANKYQEYLRRADVRSAYTDDSARTRVADVEEADEGQGEEKFGAGEMGYRAVKRHSQSDSESEQGSPRTQTTSLFERHRNVDPRATLVGSPPMAPKDVDADADHGAPSPRTPGMSMSEYPRSPTHARFLSADVDTAVAVPLLAHTRSGSRSSVGDEVRNSAGVGAGGRVPLGMGRPAGRARVGSFGSVRVGEEGRGSAASVAGVGDGTLSRLVRTPSGPREPAHPHTHTHTYTSSSTHPQPHMNAIPEPELREPLSPPPLLNLGVDDASQSSVSALSAEATNGHGHAGSS